MAASKDEHEEDQAAKYDEFKELVNMSASTLERWLETKESQEVGWKGEDGHGKGESVGHHSGKRIVEILQKKKSEIDENDREHMAKVVGYVRRHLAQRPKGDDVEHSRWTYSLKNWGHDPAKD